MNASKKKKNSQRADHNRNNQNQKISWLVLITKRYIKQCRSQEHQHETDAHILKSLDQ